MKYFYFLTAFVGAFQVNSSHAVVSLWEIPFGSHKKLIIERGDITKTKVEAIVNAANYDLAGGGGVCGAIFQAAGWNDLQSYCHQQFHDRLGARCGVGQAVITPSFGLQSQGIKYIIHAVGPDCRVITDYNQQGQLLDQAYRNALRLVKNEKSELERYNNYLTESPILSVAFPFISSGIYAFPRLRGAAIAINALCDELRKLELVNPEQVLEVRMVLFSEEDHQLFVDTYRATQLNELWVK
jgi:O-acetyl-ADP-ribose deacetylase (regulator of RNase III)